jgi:hypothetical protein
MSSRAIHKAFSSNALPAWLASMRSRVRMVKSRPNFSTSSSCHCSTSVPRRHYQAALEVAADDQLLDVEPRHDGLAGTGVVGQQEAQRLAGQHLAVDRGDLVGQGLDQGGRESEEGVEEVGKVDALGLVGEAEQVAVAI